MHGLPANILICFGKYSLEQNAACVPRHPRMYVRTQTGHNLEHFVKRRTNYGEVTHEQIEHKTHLARCPETRERTTMHFVQGKHTAMHSV